MAIQWHPLFADLLRPLLERSYEVRTNVPVGDVPREADIVVLRRTSAGNLPFQGLWRHLRTWNALEYKGRSVSARVSDVDLLVELGLGIHRHLNEEQAKLKLPLVPAGEMALWYVANRLGRRFLRDLAAKMGPLDSVEEGVWRGRILDRDVFLVSGGDVRLELDSLPLFVLGKKKLERRSAVPELLLQNESLLSLYSAYLEIFHHEVFKELETMARIAEKEFEVGLRSAVERHGLHKLIQQLGVERVIDELGLDHIDKAGLSRVIDKAGQKRVLAQILEHMSPQDREKLKRQLERK